MTYNSRQRRARRGNFPRARAVAALALLLLLAASPAISGAWNSVSKTLPSLDKEEAYRATDDTVIYDSSPTPNIIAVLHTGENRMLLKPEEIPDQMKQALVVIEDDRFYDHAGVDPIGMARAIMANFTEAKLVEGGSTITQQYIKNTYVSNEPTVNRKLKEAIYAHELEQRWSKDQIISEYLNTIYFGSGAYGLQVASMTYFNKVVSQLTLPEFALLAAIPKSPVQFSPFTEPEAALERRNLVLAKMLRHEMISQEEFDAASQTPLPTQPYQIGPENSVAPYFVEYIKEQLIARYGTRQTFEGGLRVFTTLDLGKQAAAETAVASVLNQPGDPSAALVSLEPASGYVRAMVGGTNFTAQKFNVATQGHRQPGSAFKPFVLAAAMTKGISPGTTFVSEPKHISLGGGGAFWDVSNFDSLYLGKISLEKATVYSDNAVYADLMMRVGPGAVADTAHNAGVKTNFSAQPAIALGGLDNGVTPLELASAYGTFANGGVKVTGSIDFTGNGADPISILKVTDSHNQVLEENRITPALAIDPVIAYHVNNTLKKTATQGTNQWSNLGRPCAGKSGTTEDHVDAWFSGYTPDLVTTVWVGYPAQRTSMVDIRGVRVTGGSWPSQIWNLYMNQALAATEPHDFVKPPNSDLQLIQICSDSGQLANPWCPKKESRSFFPGHLPTEKCTLHKAQDLTMPKLTGMKFLDAWKVVRAMGLDVDISFKSDPSKPADTVVDQVPKAGERVRQGYNRVTIIVAGKPGSVQPPADESPASDGD
ncbi:MAG: transglycosylase domain-containing protein [Thermoleophilia bacterium]